MICGEFEDRISDYLEGAVEPRIRYEMDAHVSQCRSCEDLLAGVRQVLEWGRKFSVPEPAPWLPARITTATPQIVRETWVDVVTAAVRWCLEPRTAMAFLTATLVLGWLGSLAGFTNIPLSEMVREPSSIYYRAEGFVNRAYGDAVQRYYRARLVTAIQFQLERFREIS